MFAANTWLSGIKKTARDIPCGFQYQLNTDWLETVNTIGFVVLFGILAGASVKNVTIDAILLDSVQGGVVEYMISGSVHVKIDTIESIFIAGIIGPDRIISAAEEPDAGMPVTGDHVILDHIVIAVITRIKIVVQHDSRIRNNRIIGYGIPTDEVVVAIALQADATCSGNAGDRISGDGVVVVGVSLTTYIATEDTPMHAGYVILLDLDIVGDGIPYSHT